MTREQFVEKYRHHLGGLVLDALACGVKGAEASMRVRTTFREIDLTLARIYDDFQPRPVDNGQKPPQQAPARKA